MSRKENSKYEHFFLLLLTLTLVAFIPIPPALKFPLLVFIGISFLILGAAFAYTKYKSFLSKKEFYRSTEGQIQKRIDYCKHQIAKNKAEIADIRNAIQELKASTDKSVPLAPQNVEEGQRLMDGFQRQMELRQAKMGFFENCRQKLESLLGNHRLALKLKAKREELKRLEENHYEDLANMEALKWDVETDIYYLRTIEELSTQMFESNSLDHAKGLQLELEKMTRELDEL